MDIADDDIQLESRVDELIERGLERYGSGDMEGALSEWEHALALDPDSDRASNYLRYVEDHHDLGGDGRERNTESTVELAYPFGVAELGLAKLRDEDLDDYESFEIVAGGAESAADGDITKTMRIKAIATSVDDGWSVNEAWVEDLVNTSEVAFTPGLADPVTTKPLDAPTTKRSEAAPKKIRRAPTSDEASFADIALEGSGDEDLEPTRARTGQSLVDGEISRLEVGPSISDEEPTMALRSPSQGLRDEPFELGNAGLGGNNGLPRKERTMPEGADRGPSPGLGPDAITAIKEGSREGFGSREESTAERSGAQAHGFDDLELDALEPTNLRPDIPDALDDQTDSGISIRFLGDEAPENTMDEELTIDRGGLLAADLLAGARAPTQDSGLLDIPMGPDLAIQQLQEETRENGLSLDFSLEDDDGVPPKAVFDHSSGGIDIGLSGEELAALDIGSSSDDNILARVSAAAPRGDIGERTQFIVSRLIDSAGEEFTEGNNAKAAVAIGHALDCADDSALAQKIIFANERRIVEILVSSLGELDEIPRLLVPLMEIPLDQINHRAAFLLTRVDGTLTLDEILDISGMSRMEALRHLCRLHAKNFLEVC